MIELLTLLVKENISLICLASISYMFSAYTALRLIQRAQKTSLMQYKQPWIITAACTLGAGTWVLDVALKTPNIDHWGILSGSFILSVCGTYAGLMLYTFPAKWILYLTTPVLALSATMVTTLNTYAIPDRMPIGGWMAFAGVMIGILVIGIALHQFANWMQIGRSLLLTAGMILIDVLFMKNTFFQNNMLPQNPNVEQLILTLSTIVMCLNIVLLGSFAIAFEMYLAYREQHDFNRLRQWVDASFEGLLLHREGKILDVNERFCQMIGKNKEQLINANFLEIVASPFQDVVDKKLQEGSSSAYEIEILTSNKRSIPVEVLTRLTQAKGETISVTAIRDLSDRKQAEIDRQEAEQKIQHLASHDPVTGLPNLSILHERLAIALEAHKKIALLHLDIDRFKSINDVFGRKGGDQLLRQVAERLQEVLRSADISCRLGGDEFIILQWSDPQGAETIAKRIMHNFSRPFDIFGQSLSIQASIGVALAPTDGVDTSTLLKNADIALTRAKREQKGGFCFFEAKMDSKMQDRRLLEQDLRVAVSRGEMHLDYQPLFSCQTGELEGFEALLRWIHPNRGRISPVDFIPIAEETGQIIEIGQWVLETACAQAATWPKPYSIAVNISPVQFRHGDFPDVIKNVLEKSHLEPHRLEIEITEGILIDDTEQALEVLCALKKLQIKTSLDDFGTGYSSLSYLKKFPFDKIKIDRSFVNGLSDSQESMAIVRAIISLGHSLHLLVTAEGVETTTQLETLKKQGCDGAQGFLLGKPMPPNQLHTLIL